MEKYQTKETINYIQNFTKKSISKRSILNKILSVIYSFLKKYKKIDNTNNHKKLPLQLTSIQLKAEQFITIANYEVLESMVKNGYELLPNQKINVENYIANLLLEYGPTSLIKKNHYIIERWLELGMNLGENIKAQYFQQLISKTKIRRNDYNFYGKKEQDFYNIYPLSFFYINQGNMKNQLENGDSIEHSLLTNQLKKYAQSHTLFYDVIA